LPSSLDPQASESTHGDLNSQTSGSNDEDNQYALDTIGRDSVYRFFLGETWQGWTIAFLILATQFWMLSIFVQASELVLSDVFVKASELVLSDDKTDLVFAWKCPPDNYECKNTLDRTQVGWLLFAVLMAAHLLKDIINGSRMIVLSSKGCYPLRKRLRFFFGGLVFIVLSTFVLFASVVYNERIATSNTELIANAVIILFLTDLDEMADTLLRALNPHWATSDDKPSLDARLDLLTQENSEIREELEQVKNENSETREELEQVKYQMTDTALRALKPHWATSDDKPCLDVRLDLLTRENSEIKEEIEQVKSENLEIKEELEQVKGKVELLCQKVESSKDQAA